MLLVVSQSTRKYAKYFPHAKPIRLVDHPPSRMSLVTFHQFDEGIAIGGGSVIDTAKLLCKHVKAYPTTYAGASRTGHAVIWHNNQKINVITPVPETMIDKRINQHLTLPEPINSFSKIDCLCHIMEAVLSPKATLESDTYAFDALRLFHAGEFLNASLYAGDAINITGTNVFHGLSYPLTFTYGVPHGEALTMIIDEARNLSKVQELL